MIRFILLLSVIAGCQTTTELPIGHTVRCLKREVTLVAQSTDGKYCIVEQEVSIGIFVKPVRGVINCDICEEY